MPDQPQLVEYEDIHTPNFMTADALKLVFRADAVLFVVLRRDDIETQAICQYHDMPVIIQALQNTAASMQADYGAWVAAGCPDYGDDIH